VPLSRLASGPSSTEVSSSRRSPAWLVPTGLLLLSVIPLIAGALRVTELSGGPELIAADPRFTASPAPVMLHVSAAAVYSILGAFQFVPGFRRRKPGWHRAAGKVLVMCGLVVGGSALWMTLFMRPAGSSALLFVFRLVFGVLMVVSVLRGYTTIRRGRVSQHRAWMMRAYAIGLGAGTQVLTQFVAESLAVPETEVNRALLLGAGWVINLCVAEWVIRGAGPGPAKRGGPVKRGRSTTQTRTLEPRGTSEDLVLGLSSRVESRSSK
jgi:uncharacterized membrane protein